MYSKLFVLRVTRPLFPPARQFGGLTPLEKFEKLRELCCTSESARRIQEAQMKLRPRNPEPPPKEKITELLDIRFKNAMVVGGASGIGFEAADCLLQGGVERVIIADVNQCTGTEAVKKLCATYGCDKAVLLLTDIAEQPSIEMAFKEVYKHFCHLDIYVNTIGVYNEKPECWDKMIYTNLLGCIRSMLLAYKYMKGNTKEDNLQGSVLINLSSYGSIANVPTMPFYSAASSGINGLTSSFGQDFHYKNSKVRCVTISTACTDTSIMKNLTKKTFNPMWGSFSNSAMKCCTRQSAKIVGKAIVNAARFGLNGSIYVIKEGKYYRYAMPDYEKLMRLEAVLL